MNKNTPNGIKNPQTPVPKTSQMNDRDFLNDALTTEKYITSSYSIALKEASHESLYRTIAIGGTIIGVGIGLMLRYDTSTGGTDLLAFPKLVL